MYTRPNFHDDNDIGSDHQPVQNIFGCQIDKPKTIHKEEISIYNKIHISISSHHPLQNMFRKICCPDVALICMAFYRNLVLEDRLGQYDPGR